MKEKKTAAVKRQLIRYIRDMNLEAGAKMPGQQELRMKFVCGAATLTNALAELAHEGVVEIRERIGVFVQNAKASNNFSRRIGVLASARRGNPFMTLLCLELENALNSQDCRTVWFWPSLDGDRPRCGMDDIPGFAQAIRDGEIDGVISMVGCDSTLPFLLKARGIPLVGLMDSTPGLTHFDLDYRFVIEQSVEHLVRAGFRRLEFMALSRDEGLGACFLASARMHGLDDVSERHVHVQWFDGMDEMFLDWMNGIFYDWLNRPQDNQPQGILIPDEMLALHFRLFLLKNTAWQTPSSSLPFMPPSVCSAWCPEVLTMYSKDFGMPVLPTNTGYWVLDVRDMVAGSVANFLSMMRSGRQEAETLYFRPSFITTTVV